MLISVITAAKFAGISLPHFRRLIKADSLKIVEIRGKYFLMRGEFDSWLARRRKVA